MKLRNVSLFFVVILFFTILCPSAILNYGEPLTPYSIVSSEYYTVHEPIIIDSDQDFVDYGFPGNGSAENPYRLERLNISSSAPFGMAVSVRDTHAYFTIRDCYIVSEYIGIALLHVAAGTGLIVNNTLISSSGTGGGISIQTVNCTVSDNDCTNWGQGIHLNQASHCIVSRNAVSDSSYQGINIRYSDNSTIINNRITNSTQHGLVFVGTSKFNVVYNNSFINNGNVAEYEVDNEQTGILGSQGYDEGSDNAWYDAQTKIGNLWSDYSGSGSYAIDGSANSLDLYPINSQPSQSYDFVVVLLVFFALAVPIIVIGYRRLHR